MKRIGQVLLVVLAGVLFPVLIWVALLDATREPLLRTMRRVASVGLALLASMLLPLLIWVALGVAASQWIRERRLQWETPRTVGGILAAARLSIQWDVAGGKSLAAAVFLKRPIPEIRELLARARL